MADQDIEWQLRRTLAIIRQMADGMHLTLPNGQRIGMGEDLSIGFMFEMNGEWRVGGLSTLDLKGLNEVLNENGIHFPVPTDAR